ncbi:MAG: FlgD immunoglobulin-like domain containing protein [Candidatus Rifleibacteriota bacterium]
MKKANRAIYNRFLLLVLGLVFTAQISFALESIVPADKREIAIQQGQQAKKLGVEADLGVFLNAPLFAREVEISADQFKGIKGSIRAVVGGRNFSASDIDLAQVPFSTSNGYGLSNLYHDSGQWPGTNGNPDADDGVSSFGSNWAGEIYDTDGNGHYPSAVLRYIGTHCYIFVPVMYFPTLPRGISSTEDQTPAAEVAWGLYWPDSIAFSNGPYYYAPGTNGTVLEPRFILGADKNLARLKLKELADHFDGLIYPKMREIFGIEPDIDGDPKIFILLDDIRDGTGSFRGYFWAGNQFPRTSQAMSNEKELLNIDMFPSFALATQDTLGTVAHEFVHMIIFNEGYWVENGMLYGMERWLEEAMTQYGQYLYNGLYTSNLDEFIKYPDTILVEDRVSEVWLGPNPFPNYGASFLWMFYLVEKYGGSNTSNFLRNIIRNREGGMKAIDAALIPFGTDSTKVFADWIIANYLDKTRKLDGSSLNDGKWGYGVDNDFNTTNDLGVNERLPVKFSEKVILTSPVTARSSNVNPWAGDYIEISGNTGNLNIGFDGDDRSQFKAAVIKRGPQVDTAVEFLYLNDKQAGNLIIQNYGSGGTYENIVFVPMVTTNGNYEKMNYVYSMSFDDLKVAIFPNPTFENYLHIIVRTDEKFAAEPRLQMTYEGEQGYLTMVPVNDSTYIANYTVKQSGEGVIEANGTNSNGIILSNSLKFSAVYYPPNSQGLLKASFASLKVPAGSLRQGGTVLIAAPENPASYEGLTRISANFDVGLPVEKAAVPLELQVPLDAMPKPEKAGLYRVTSAGPKWIGKVDFVDGKAICKVDTSCSLFVGVDDANPIIKSDAQKHSEGWIAVDVSDKGSGIDPASVKVRYEGHNLPVKYDESGKILVNTRELLDGNYEFSVEAADNAGNTNTAMVRALVVGTTALHEISTYPNPARANATVRVAFTGPASNQAAAYVKIYDVKGHKVSEMPLAYTAGGVYEAKWDLRNSEGDAVANGVYFAEVKADLGGQSTRQRRKIAVLR